MLPRSVQIFFKIHQVCIYTQYKICLTLIRFLHVSFHRWGCTHEQTAVEVYTMKAKENHQSFVVLESGLFLDQSRPYVGASPDGLISCTCCGKGTLEVKCPFCFKEGLPEEDQENFCMSRNDGKWRLKRSHAYYYQIQMQLAVCKLSYCDFVVWTENDIVVERIMFDDAFYEEVMEDIRHFFIYGMLPEIIGKWFTRRPVADSSGIVTTPTVSSAQANEDTEDYSKVWCYCSQPSYGTMIKCDSSECSIQWFHCDCLRIRGPPKGKWYCPSCHKLPQKNKRKRSRPT